MSDCRIVLVARHQFYLVEDAVMKHLKPAIDLAHGRHSVETASYSIKEGHHQLWAAVDGDSIIGALVTYVEHYPLLKMLNYLWIGGDRLDDWNTQMLETLDKFAKENDCSGAEVCGRYGWKKYMEKFGWQTEYIICQRMFDDDVVEEKRDAA